MTTTQNPNYISRRVVKIYALVDPRTGSVRYVGKTETSLRRRLSMHISHVRTGYLCGPCQKWIAELMNVGLRPQIIALEEVDRTNWESAERKWINHYRSLDAQLLNISDGGVGFTSKQATEIQKKCWQSPEYRAKKTALAKERQKRLWEDPEYRKRLTAKRKEQAEGIDARAKMSGSSRIGKTGFRGVHYIRKNSYQAHVGGKQHLGHYKNPVDAARRWDEYALETYGAELCEKYRITNKALGLI